MKIGRTEIDGGDFLPMLLEQYGVGEEEREQKLFATVSSTQSWPWFTTKAILH